MKIAISMSTYQRQDNKTPELIKRALDSIFNQTYKNFKVFLIGDRYENEEEILSIIKNYKSDKIYFQNLKIAEERDFYKDKMALWSYGGVNAVNVSVDKALDEGFEYICHLDHDDWWYPSHLEVIIECLNKTKADWVCTKSTYDNANMFLPNLISDEKYINFEPGWAKLIHSSVCFNFRNIPLKYRDLYKLTGKVGLPADADLWERIKVYTKQNNKKCIFINELTCRHDEEGFERR